MLRLTSVTIINLGICVSLDKQDIYNIAMIENIDNVSLSSPFISYLGMCVSLDKQDFSECRKILVQLSLNSVTFDITHMTKA